MIIVPASDPIVEAVRMRPIIEQHADEMERRRCLVPPVISALRAAGLYRIAIPQSLGGAELDPMDQIRVVEELARVDASVAWCVMIGSDGGFFTAFLAPEVVAKLVSDDPDLVFAGFTDPVGRATRVTGGYQVSGRWPFGSGCTHSTWLASGCTVHPDGAASGSRTREHWRIAVVRADDSEVLDTWHSTGLRASGSFDYRLTDVFVPHELTFCFSDAPQRDGPLYSLPTLFRANMAGIPLGVARGAVDDLLKLSSCSNVTASRTYDERVLHRALAQAEAKIDAARAFVLDSVGSLWDALMSGREPGPKQRALFRLALTTAFRSGREAVQFLYEAGGGPAVYGPGSLDRRLRDVITMGQHALVRSNSYESIGRALVGLEPADLMF